VKQQTHARLLNIDIASHTLPFKTWKNTQDAALFLRVIVQFYR
jgi:hypothetical protein